MWDIKSRRVPVPFLSSLINHVHSHYALTVTAVGSFHPNEVLGVEAVTAPPVRPVIFAHSLGDVQAMAHGGSLPPGCTVFFNGGSFLWDFPNR